MAGDYASRELVSCDVCKTGPTEKVGFVTHILGKRHQKTVKTLKSTKQSMRNDECKRTLYVSGYDMKTPIETLIGAFWKFGILNVTSHGNYIFIELLNRKYVKEALSVRHFLGKKRLKVSLRKFQKAKTESSSVPISWRLKTAMDKLFTSPQNQWSTINMLVSEIELKVTDYEKREFLREHIEDFLRPHFPSVVSHIFGSSANNLGFVGCDVDLFVHLGVDPWSSGTKGEKESKASDLTWYIARELRRTRVAQKVQAICRARVPIVKFEEPITKLQVDLSFRHGMPVYNTQLICQYTHAHQLVRPYLMVIRYWAKLQGVAGGGQPSYLITNYGFTMMMLFYLMVRQQPLIPSVAQLKLQLPGGFKREHTISGWDCSFGQNLTEWSNKRHSVSVMELVQEFFSYYANLDAKNWVISPLTGQLLKKDFVKQRDMRNLAPCMWAYCQQETDIQTDTALCLQDPFEHSFNITRGLQEGPFTEFQYKCKRAAEICEDIIKGRKPLALLFEDIYMDDEVLNNIHECDSSTEVDITQEEVITLEDSDDTSQDEIEVLNNSNKEEIVGVGEKNAINSSSSSSTSIASVSKADITLASTSGASSSKSNSQTNEEDFLVIKGTEDEEIEIHEKTVNLVNEKNEVQEIEIDDKISDLPVEIVSVNETENEVTENGVTNIQKIEVESDSSINIPETMPENKMFKFSLDFSMAREFSITFDGTISGGKTPMTSEYDIGQAASSLVHFILQQCLNIDLSTVDSLSSGKKRKCENSENLESGKRIKNADGDSVQVVMTYRKLVEYRCTDETQLWIGRKKVAKAVPLTINSNPLHHEMAVTEAQLSKNKIGSNEFSGKLDFVISVWQNIDIPSKILVTGDSLSDGKKTKSMMIPFFFHFKSKAQNLLKKVLSYIISTSSKR